MKIWDVTIAFLQGVEEGSLGVDVTIILLNINCYSLLFYMLQDARSYMKMLVFDRTRFSPLFWHFCSPVHIYSLPFIMLHM